MTIQHFTELHAWQEAHKLVLGIYKAIKNFPIEEKFALADQMKRCSISVTSNIAEGFGRNHAKDKLQFYIIARGSLLELESQLITGKDLGYIKNEAFSELKNQIVVVAKLLTGLMKSIPARSE